MSGLDEFVLLNPEEAPELPAGLWQTQTPRFHPSSSGSSDLELAQGAALTLVSIDDSSTQSNEEPQVTEPGEDPEMISPLP
jgi:hypothetical protein